MGKLKPGDCDNCQNYSCGAYTPRWFFNFKQWCRRWLGIEIWKSNCEKCHHRLRHVCYNGVEFKGKKNEKSTKV